MDTLERELQAMLDYEPQHISELSDKTARGILGSTLWADNYHNAIMLAAGELVAAGMGGYEYLCQWSSGKTCWTSLNRHNTITVDRYGKVQL